MIRRLQRNESGLSSLEWIGVGLTALVLLSLIPQFRAVIDVLYENLVGKNKELADALKTVHYWLNKTLLVLIVLHVAAALKHHVLDRDDVLTRMLPFLKPRTPGKEI